MPDDKEEHEIWASQGNQHNEGTPAYDILNQYFPELVQENGAVDPTLAIVALVEKIKELEDKTNGS